MRVMKIKVTKLFGIFDYEIDMNLSERVTILIAPNGFGKTKILEMLHGLLGRNYTIFRQTPFEKYEVIFDSGEKISVESSIDENEKPHLTINGEDLYPPKSNLYELPLSLQRLIEELAPVRRIGSRQFRDLTTGEVIHYTDLISKYADLLPEELSIEHYPYPRLEKLLRLIGLRVRFIKTQRLGVTHIARERLGSGERIPDMEDRYAVIGYQKELRAEIQRVLAESAEKSQSLDSTFPRRLIDRLNSGEIHANFDEQVSKLNELNDKRREIAEVGLLDKQTENDEIPRTSDRNIASVLSVLVKDTEEKLAVFDEFLSKIKLFREMINKRFQFKRMVISKEKGYIFINKKGDELPLEHLSSGEQHELVLFYELLFNTSPQSLVIIDEPELSLHIDWQREFLKDLRAIIEVSHFDVLLATHSPDIVQGELDLLVDLGQMVNVDE